MGACRARRRCCPPTPTPMKTHQHVESSVTRRRVLPRRPSTATTVRSVHKEARQDTSNGAAGADEERVDVPRATSTVPPPTHQQQQQHSLPQEYYGNPIVGTIGCSLQHGLIPLQHLCRTPSQFEELQRIPSASVGVMKHTSTSPTVVSPTPVLYPSDLMPPMADSHKGSSAAKRRHRRSLANQFMHPTTIMVTNSMNVTPQHQQLQQQPSQDSSKHIKAYSSNGYSTRSASTVTWRRVRNVVPVVCTV